MIKTYRQHGQALCWTCGRAGLTGPPGKEFYLERTNFPTDDHYYYLGLCPVCDRWTVYRLDPFAFCPGDDVIVLDKSLDPAIGSYSALKDTGWKKWDMAYVVKTTDLGGIVAFDMVNNRVGVFAPTDLALMQRWEDLIEFEEETFPIEDPPKSWWVRVIDWLWDKF